MAELQGGTTIGGVLAETIVGSQKKVDEHANDNVRHITSAERTAWNSKETTTGAQAKANTAEANAKSASAPTGRTITGGNGLSGGGDLSANRTIALGTPSTLTPSTTNAVTSTSHTHDIATATQAEAEAGTIATKFMTPQRTAQAIAKLAPTPTASSVMATGGVSVQSEINSLKSSVSDGKNKIATAITDRGVSASGSETHAQLATKIGQIESDIKSPISSEFLAVFKQNISKMDIVTVTTDFNKLPNLTSVSGTGTRRSEAIAMTEDESYLFIGSNQSLNYTDYLVIYKNIGNGSFVEITPEIPDPPKRITSISFSNDGKTVFMTSDDGMEPQGLGVYKFENDKFTKLSIEGEFAGWSKGGGSISPDGNYIALIHTTSTYLSVWKRGVDNVYRKLPDTAFSSMPTQHGESIKFSPDGNYLALNPKASPYLMVYKRTGDTFTKLNVPSSLSNPVSLDFSRDSNYLVASSLTAPYITIYKRTGDAFTKLPNVDVTPTGTCSSIKFNDDGSFFAVSMSASPWLMVYKKQGDSFVKMPDLPQTGLTSNLALAFHKNYLSASSLSSSNVVNLFEIRNSAYKATGELSFDSSTSTYIGYAKESGSTNQKRIIKTLWR